MGDYESYKMGWGTTKADAISVIRSYIEDTYKKYDLKVISIKQDKAYPFNTEPGWPDRIFKYVGVVEYNDPREHKRMRMKTYGHGHYSTKDEWLIGVKGSFDKPYTPRAVKKKPKKKQTRFDLFR